MKLESLSVNLSFFYNVIFLGWANYPLIFSFQLSFSFEIIPGSINLGLTKMAEACPGSTKSSLEDIQAWYIRDETYSAALAELVNAQGKRPLAACWGDGTTSSSDG